MWYIILGALWFIQLVIIYINVSSSYTSIKEFIWWHIPIIPFIYLFFLILKNKWVEIYNNSKKIGKPN